MSENSADQNALAQGRNFVWHELNTPDLAGSIEFYEKALGMGTTQMPMEGFNYNMFTRNGVPICGVMDTNQMQMPGVPPHWSVYLSVEDCDASVASCVEHGAQVVVPAMDIPTIGRMCLIADPQGAHIWLFQPSM